MLISAQESNVIRKYVEDKEGISKWIQMIYI